MNARQTKSQKCCFCEKPGATIPGFSKKLKPRLACGACAFQYDWLKANFGKWTPAQAVQPAIDVSKLTESAQQNSLFDNEYSTIRVGESEWCVTSAGAGYRARLRLKDNLEQCACTHKARRHVDDGQGNLLHCRDCDCDHFWYAVPQQHRPANLIVLNQASVAAEASVIGKLRAVTEERGATKDEVIAAHKGLSR